MKRKSIQFLALLTAVSYGLVACDKHDHDHEGHDEHGDHDHAEGEEHAAHEEDADHDHDHAEGEEHHGHDHGGQVAGPNGGRVLLEVEPHLEFFVTADRKVQISQLSEDLKVVPIGTQMVSLIAGDRANPTELAFAKSGDSLVSDKVLPEGNDFPVVLDIKASADAEKTRQKFNLNLADCPTCDYKEYACTCDHGSE